MDRLWRSHDAIASTFLALSLPAVGLAAVCCVAAAAWSTVSSPVPQVISSIRRVKRRPISGQWLPIDHFVDDAHESWIEKPRTQGPVATGA